MPTTEIYDTVGSHTSTVPSGVWWAVIECWGAEGGTSTGPGSTAPGGKGGYLKARVPVTPGETLNIHVGGTGGALTGGANGGGDGARVAGTDPDGESGGGGGASDVRQGGDTLSDRIVVGGAGAGGGAAEGSGAAYAGGDGGYPDGVAGGDSNGQYSDSGGPPGTQTSAGGNGSFGVGGSAGQTTAATSGAGAAGWYGGGIGSSDAAYAQAPGGGGGSSYTSGTVLDDTTGARTGDGKVVITYDDAPAAPSGLTATEDASENVDLSWTDNASTEDEYRVYRTDVDSPAFPGDYTKIATLAADSTTYQDTTVSEGTTYSYAVTAWSNFGESSETTAAVTTSLEATTNLAIDATNGDQFDLSWTDNSEGEDGYRIYVSTDGGSTWSLDKSVAANATTATTTNLLDGQTYDIEVRPYTSDAEGTSPTVTGTTALPAASAPTLGNGVEDEVAVAIPDVIDNGLYRVQIRETGESTWDSNATGFAETTVTADADTSGTEDTTIGGREDGEEYEVRVRTESADAGTTAWTSPVSIVTKFPEASGLSSPSQGRTTLDLSWTDNADNEDGQYIERRELLEDGNTDWAQLVDVGANTESHTDASVIPSRTYEYRIRAYTDDTDALSNTASVTSDTARVRTTAVPATGWYVEVDHPSGRTLTPEIVDKPTLDPTLNGLPTATIPVPGTDRWNNESDWEQAPIRVWEDGHRQPLEEIDSVEQTPSGAVITAVGGVALRERQQVDVIERDAHLVAQDTIQAAGLVANVDDPAAGTDADVPLASPSTKSEMLDALDTEPTATSLYDVLDGGELVTRQTAHFVEAKDATVQIASVANFDDATFSAGAGVNITDWEKNGTPAAIETTVDLDHTIPSGNAEAAARFQAPNGDHAGFRILIDGEEVLNFPADSLTAESSPGWQQTSTASTDLSDSVTVRLEATGASAGSSPALYVDALALADTRVTPGYTETVTDGVIEGPDEYPASVQIQTADEVTVRQVVGGGLTVGITNTGGAQALALSNDQGATYPVSAANSDSVEGSFSSGSTTLRARFTLGGYDSQPSTSPAGRTAPQTISEWALDADLEDVPLLANRSFDATGEEILTRVADYADDLWEVTWDESTGALAVEWTNAGQRAADPRVELTDYTSNTDYSKLYRKAVIKGTLVPETDVTVTVQHDTWVDLPDKFLSETGELVRTPNETTKFERGVDYELEPNAGRIKALSTGSITDGADVLIDYQRHIVGEFESNAYDGTYPVFVETLPEITTSRNARQAARVAVGALSDPLVTWSVTVSDLPPSVDLVDALALEQVPADGPLETWSVSSSPGQLQLQGGNRDPISETLGRIQSRLAAVSQKV